MLLMAVFYSITTILYDYVCMDTVFIIIFHPNSHQYVIITSLWRGKDTQSQERTTEGRLYTSFYH